MDKTAFANPACRRAEPRVPTGRDSIHEIKYDGYCLIVQRDGRRVRLFTKNGHDWTAR
jgi:bifunctional non-homologous end joining protein LigD